MTSDETGMVAIFQSTLPREERPVRRYSLPLISVNFNPRSHERSDNIQNLTFALTKRFQSTLPREERHVLEIYIYDMCIFQSTLPREERQYFDEPNETPAEFQSTLPREERLILISDFIAMHKFQSTLPREGRLLHDLSPLLRHYFNPRSHERSDLHLIKTD